MTLSSRHRVHQLGHRKNGRGSRREPYQRAERWDMVEGNGNFRRHVFICGLSSLQSHTCAGSRLRLSRVYVARHGHGGR